MPQTNEQFSHGNQRAGWFFSGTGIAPMRSYLRLLFHDKAGAASDGSRKFKGLAWLFMGASARLKGEPYRAETRLFHGRVYLAAWIPLRSAILQVFVV